MSSFIESIESNPLLQGLPIEIPWGSWLQRLAVNPFKGEDFQSLSPVVRELILDQYTQLYVPTAGTAQIAFSIHRMIIGSLIERHPHNSEHKRYVYELCRASDDSRVQFPKSSAAPRGMIIEGVTKLGKSRLVTQTLQQYPQVIVRKRDDRAGWLELRQLVYLVVPMPTDASKSSFLMTAFIELDQALGTSYAEEATIRNATVDIQLVRLLALLVKHRCGALVIEEGQDSNELNAVKFGRSFHTFFLRVLNTGIPTILIGNPKAFEELKTNSQLMGRLTNPGAPMLTPCASADHPDWVEDFVPGVWGVNLLPEPDEPIPDLEKFLWERTGGFVHFLSMLRREATRLAIVCGDVRLTPEHINQAMLSQVMVEGFKIITSYWNGQQGKDTNYVDVPGSLRPDLRLRNRRGRPNKAVA